MLEDATRLVSLADVFSRNENVAEVPTEHVRFGDERARMKITLI